MLTIEEINRYSRQLFQSDIGPEGQLKIKTAKVLVIGAGGLGCPVLQYLAGAGVGSIGILDFDQVEIHNLHRQVLYTTNDIGKKKAVVAAERLRAQNPHCELLVFDKLLCEENARAIISQFDIVVDGTDNFRTRYIVNDACVLLGKPLVYGSVLNFEAQVAVFNYQGGKNLRDLYPEPPKPEDVPSCSDNGVLGIVPGMAGTLMCSLVLKIILAHEILNNALLLIDFHRFKFQVLRFFKDSQQAAIDK
ncbi:HesA/MoeB/ThiF family protein [Sediminibacterium soli]|uniref:HesA/MoeB/ThiF family protein n=1 Tax=Sediminibacterium soli TaxID=2698829 RepID=UPI00137B0A98|nr:HesA/MoeB/ThiF family protein [Sediminibacterium soli]NCI46411.1 HesA/MoeB/ThiF family protein [Sediminibacterium soli]